MTEEKKSFSPPAFKVYSPKDLSKNWFVYWYDADGRRQRKYGDINQFDTLKERQSAVKRMIRELESEAVAGLPSLWIRLDEYLEGRKGVLRKKSYQTMRSKINKMRRWMGQRKPTKELVQKFFQEQLNGHSTTYNVTLTILGKMLRDVGSGDLVEGIKTVREQRTPARYFQPSQVQELKRYISRQDPELWLFIQFIFYCFIRPGELRWLQAGDILLSENRILIRGEISKNRKTEYVAIPEAFRPSLAFLKDLRPGQFLFPGIQSPEKPIGMSTMSKRHRTILRKLKYGDDHCLYSWKHTGAVMAVKAGIWVKELQLQLRHHSLDQVDEYLRQMGVQDLVNLEKQFPAL